MIFSIQIQQKMELFREHFIQIQEISDYRDSGKYAISANKSTERMNIERFHISYTLLLSLNPLMGCTFIRDFSALVYLHRLAL